MVGVCITAALFALEPRVSAGASEQPDLTDAFAALDAATARWSLLKCPTPRAIELQSEEQLWRVRFSVMGIKQAYEWRVAAGTPIAGVCSPAPKLAAPAELEGFGKALRAAIAKSREQLSGPGAYSILITRTPDVWRVRFTRVDTAAPGGGITVVLDGRSFRLRTVQPAQ